MEMSKLAAKLRNLKEKKRAVIYTSKKGVQVTVTHTAKHSDDDYAVGLVIPGREEFRPTHIRLLIDFYIKRESNEPEARELHKCLESVYSGEDPATFSDALEKIQFPMHLDEAETNLYVSQLLLIEQDFNFGPGAPKTSKMDPPRQYTMRFFRWVASGDNQIDRIIFAAAGRKYPAPEKYSTPIRFQK
jgi:hypothetical protein